MLREVHEEGANTFADGVHRYLHAVGLVADLRDPFQDQFEFGDVRGLLVDFLFVFHADSSEFFVLHFSFEKELFAVLLKVFICFVHDFLIEFFQIYNLEFLTDQI